MYCSHLHGLCLRLANCSLWVAKNQFFPSVRRMNTCKTLLCRMASFAVVEFEEESTMDVIPITWIHKEDSDVCWWPSQTWKNEKIQRAMRDCIMPDLTSRQFRIKILKHSGKFSIIFFKFLFHFLFLCFLFI